MVGLLNHDNIKASCFSAATATTPVGVYGPGNSNAIRLNFNDPDHRLGNYTVTTNEGTLTILAPPSIRINEPTNGAVYFTGSDVPVQAEVRGASWPVESVLFGFSTNQLSGSTTNGTNFTTTLTNVARGSYSLQAWMTNRDGATIRSESVAFSVIEIPWAVGPVVTNGLEVFQPGLYFQDMWITNISSMPLSAVLVKVSALPSGTTVYNAVGLTNGTNLVRFDYPTPAGQTLRLRFEYDSESAKVPKATFEVKASKPAPPLSVTGTSIPFYWDYPRGNALAWWRDNTMVLQFATVVGRKYYIQYSSQLPNWVTVQPAVVGKPNNSISWLDFGPPKTISPPVKGSTASRFYRVVEVR